MSYCYWEGELSIVNDCIVFQGILVKCLKKTGSVTVPYGTEELQRDDTITIDYYGITCDGFQDSENISSITLPASLKTIGSNTFTAMRFLKKFIYQGTIKQFCSIEGIVYLLLNSPALTSVECSDGTFPIPKVIVEKRLAAIINEPETTVVYNSTDLPAGW